MSKKAVVILPNTLEILNNMGEQIKLARLRRRLSAKLEIERIVTIVNENWKLKASAM